MYSIASGSHGLCLQSVSREDAARGEATRGHTFSRQNGRLGNRRPGRRASRRRTTSAEGQAGREGPAAASATHTHTHSHHIHTYVTGRTGMYVHINSFTSCPDPPARRGPVHCGHTRRPGA